jgi:hypothetical protein
MQAAAAFIKGGKLLEELERHQYWVLLWLVGPKDIEAVAEITQRCVEQARSLRESLYLGLPENYELFTLAAYVRVTTGKAHLNALIDLVQQGYAAHGRRLRHVPTQETLSKRINRFRKPEGFPLGPDFPRGATTIPEGLQDRIREVVDSGELRQTLLSDYPA